MSSQASSLKSLLTSLAVVMAALALVQESRAMPTSDKQQPEPLSPSDASLMLPKAEQCKEDEQPAVGRTPDSEPTCDRPHPVWLRMFVILDYVPCFCKEGLVRETKSGRCIKLADCPKKE